MHKTLSTCGHIPLLHRPAHRTQAALGMNTPPAGYESPHLEAGSLKLPAAVTRLIRRAPAGRARLPDFRARLAGPHLMHTHTHTHTGFGLRLSARSFLSPFTSRTTGNAERGARRLRTSTRPAQRRPIPSVHANEAPNRASAPPPAAWGRSNPFMGQARGCNPAPQCSQPPPPLDSGSSPFLYY